MKTIETNYSMRPDAGLAGSQATQRAPGGSPVLAAQDTDETAAARKIEHSVAYMLRHLDKPLQVATLAALVNVSPSHYFALFKRLTGHAPIDFFIHLRMHRACELLDSTWLRVKEVAAELGYEDPFYFSRIFKSVNRVAPSEYRAMPQESRDDIKKMTLSFTAAALETCRPLQIASAQLSREAVVPTSPPKEPTQDPDWKERILHEKRSIIHSTRKAFCYAG